jgi:hypothetical protein
MAFDFDADDTSHEIVRGVANEMAGGGLKPLSEEEIALREIEREVRLEETRQREEQWRLEHQQQEAAKLEAAQRQAAVAAKAERDKAQRERSGQIDRELRRREMLDLRMAAARQDSFQRNVENAHRNAVAYQQRQTILSELEAMINPPEPPPERIVVVEADQEDDTFCGVKITRPNLRRSWW